MKHASLTCDAHDLILTVEVETDSLWDCAESVLGPFVISSSKPDAYLLRIRHGSPPSRETAPPGMTRIWSGRHPDGIHLAYYAGADVERMDLLELGSIEIRRAQREAEIVVAPEGEWCLGRGCVVPVLCCFLGDAHHHVVHAACLHVPGEDTQQAVLLAGPSGSGKTTTSLALGHAGMKMMGDDVCFITRRSIGGDEKLMVWGLLLDCKVHRRMRELLPWLNQLKSHPAASEDEEIIETRHTVGVAEPIEAAPVAIFLLDERNRRAHRIKSIDKLDALSELTRQNVRASSPIVQQQAREAFRMLTDLVSNCETYSLSVGPSLDGLCDEVLSVLRRSQT